MSDADTKPWDGRPENPERDGVHILINRIATGSTWVCLHWRADVQLFQSANELLPRSAVQRHYDYQGPFVTPSEHAALLAERDALRARADDWRGMLDSVLTDTARELGCAPDNEAILAAVADLKAALATARAEAWKAGQEAAAAALPLMAQTYVVAGNREWAKGWKAACHRGAENILALTPAPQEPRA
jgi:hypothetical protein